MPTDCGNEMYQLSTELFPICRSITGNGVRKTFEIIKRHLPKLKTYALIGPSPKNGTLPMLIYKI